MTTTVKKKPKFDRRDALATIIEQSTMSTEFRVERETGRLAKLTLDIKGPAANIPSVSNTRLLHVSKSRALGLASNAQMPHFRLELIKELKRMQPQSTINPKHQVFLDGLTHLWNSVDPAIRNLVPAEMFADDKTNRLFVLLLLADHCTAHDSHNTIKAACDWLEHVKIIKNDRNVDCFAIRKKHVMLAGLDRSSTTVVVLRAERTTARVARLIDKLINLGSEKHEN